MIDDFEGLEQMILLISQEGDVISTEARARYNEIISKDRHGVHNGLTFWAPNINIDRDPRWGRGQETYGEDPFLASQIGVSFVEGLQGTNQKYLKVISTPKHFAVFSGPQPSLRSLDVVVRPRDLYETYLPVFESCVSEAGAFSVMASYSSLDGVPCCSNDFLLNDVLRNSWNFKGYVVSDCDAIDNVCYGHRIAPDLVFASALAVKGGCDMVCGKVLQGEISFFMFAEASTVG